MSEVKKQQVPIELPESPPWTFAACHRSPETVEKWTCRSSSFLPSVIIIPREARRVAGWGGVGVVWRASPSGRECDRLPALGPQKGKPRLGPGAFGCSAARQLRSRRPREASHSEAGGVQWDLRRREGLLCCRAKSPSSICAPVDTAGGRSPSATGGTATGRSAVARRPGASGAERRSGATSRRLRGGRTMPATSAPTRQDAVRA